MAFDIPVSSQDIVSEMGIIDNDGPGKAESVDFPMGRFKRVIRLVKSLVERRRFDEGSIR